MSTRPAAGFGATKLRHDAAFADEETREQAGRSTWPKKRRQRRKTHKGDWSNSVRDGRPQGRDGVRLGMRQPGPQTCGQRQK
jgi:hypothetical protein